MPPVSAPRRPAAAGLPSPLQRAFKALLFDWDGTAVENRSADATALAGLVGDLVDLGVWVVVVTGTNVGHLDRQLVNLLPPKRRRRLLLCTNRGSEVFGFDARGRQVCRWQRVATSDEEQALTAVAESVRDAVVARTGLPVRIVYDRLNRRKVDVIPVPEWADPPKSRIDDLLAAVEDRLRSGGLAGGLNEVIELARDRAVACGLPDARITSDVKHVEIGLTDKGDSVAWVRRRLLRPLGIALPDVLVGGDEFGPVAGFAGSDDRLRAGTEGAVVVSVGNEPNGAPAGVLHLGGGPAQFRALLADQVGRHRALAPARKASLPRPMGGDDAWVERALALPMESAWLREERGFQPVLEHEVETRLSIGNGAIGVRGSLEQPTAASRPRTFVAGLFEMGDREPRIPALVPAPDWLRLRIAVNGSPVSNDGWEVLSHTRTLDLHRGVVVSEWRQRGGDGLTVQVRALRCASQANRALALQVVQVLVDRRARVTLEAEYVADGDGLERERSSRGAALYRTRHGAAHLAIAASCALYRRGRRVTRRAGPAGRFEWRAAPGEPATFVRLLSLARAGRDADPVESARASLRRVRPERALEAHRRATNARWQAGDVAVDGDDDAQEALRFAVHHLQAAANPEDERVSIGARALTGDAYLGHVFWDTEIFALPFYTFTWPAAARALLMYRYHTLPGARAKAQQQGFHGAMYAWESADTGEEATPPYVIWPDGRVVPVLCGVREQHISADVAYAVWQYWEATRDESFLLDAGAEILLETARFWASRATLEGDGAYHIRVVIGPDEYHEAVDDNAFTNGMAKWNLERGLEVARLLAERWPERWQVLRTQLDLTDPELAQWQDVATRIVDGFDPRTRLFEQFAGFYGLDEIDLSAYASRTVPMDVILGPERTRRSQVIKQADVLMLLALLGDRFDRATLEANFLYYEPRCGHGSSLSPATHALLAARLGDAGRAERYFRDTARIDLGDTMGNAAQGVHIAALGGLWQVAVFGFAGFRPGPDGLAFEPHLPPGWRGMELAVQWRGRTVRVEIRAEPGTVTATLERGDPVAVRVGETARTLTAGTAFTCRYRPVVGDRREARV